MAESIERRIELTLRSKEVKYPFQSPQMEDGYVPPRGDPNDEKDEELAKAAGARKSSWSEWRRLAQIAGQ